MTNAVFVADFIIRTMPVDPLQLQILLYQCQGIHYAVTKGRKLFRDKIYAGDYVPYVPAVYYKYREYGFSHIPVETDSEKMAHWLSAEELQTVSMVLEYYGAKPAEELLLNCMQKEQPYIRAKNTRNKAVDQKFMSEWFQNKIEFAKEK